MPTSMTLLLRHRVAAALHVFKARKFNRRYYAQQGEAGHKWPTYSQNLFSNVTAVAATEKINALRTVDDDVLCADPLSFARPLAHRE